MKQNPIKFPKPHFVRESGDSDLFLINSIMPTSKEMVSGFNTDQTERLSATELIHSYARHGSRSALIEDSDLSMQPSPKKNK